jgi:uncharacterized protein
VKEMKRKEKQLTTDETNHVLQAGVYGVLSTADLRGIPYGVPLHYVYHNGGIYFHCAVDGLKLDLLNENSRVSFCVVVDVTVIPERFSTNYSSVILSGRAYEVFEQEKQDSLTALLVKYSPDYLELGQKYLEKAWERTKVYRIDIDHCTGKGNIKQK